MLFAGNSIQPSARTAKEVRLASRGLAQSAGVPFNQIASGFLRWMIGSIDRRVLDYVTSVDLAMLHESLADIQVRDQVFSYANVSRFFDLNYHLDIATPLVGPTGATGPVFRPGPAAPTRSSDGPIGLAGLDGHEPATSRTLELAGGTGPTGVTGSVTAFPMIPELIMTPQGMSSVNFKVESPIDRQYEEKLAAYFNQLLAVNAGPKHR